MNRLFEFFVNRWRVTYLLIISSIIFGAVSLADLPQESEPEVEIPMAVVTVSYPGAAPSDMENLVTRKVEDKIDTLDNIEEITSNTRLGLTNITVEFEADADIDESIRDLKDKMDEVKADLPDNAEDPVVMEIRMSDSAIITFSLAGKGISEERLSDFAEDIETNLERISGVSKVELLGQRDKEIQVLLDRQKIESLGLSAGQIVQKIQTAHLDFPIGEAIIDGINISLRLDGEFEGAEDLKKLPLITTEQGTVFLEDVASIKETREKETSISMLALNNQEAEKTISLQVFKKTGGNIIDITDNAKAEIERMKKEEELPSSLEVEVSNDNSKFIRDDLDRLVNNAFQTIIIVTLFIWLAMGWREAIIAGLTIPLTFLLTFFVLSLLDQTLNSMTLFALVLSLGLIVDNTIVITEGIFDNLRIKKLPAKEAALNSARTFWSPITSGTLTTVSAFVPMLLVSGILGEYLSIIPITVGSTLMWSLVVALFFVPTVATSIFKNLKTHSFKEAFFIHKLKEILRKILNTLLKHKWKRRSLYLTMASLLAGVFALVGAGLVLPDMFPSYDADYFNINIEMPPGTKLERTYEEALQVEEIVKDTPYLDNYFFAIGAGAIASTDMMSAGGSSSANEASFTVNLIPAKERDTASYEIANQIREQIQEIKTPGKITLEELQAGPPSGKDVEVRIFGDNLEEMEVFAKKVKKELENTEGAIEVEDDISLSSGEFVFSFNRERMDYFGLSASDVANEIRTAVFGTEAADIARGDDDIKINVSVDWQNKDEIPTTIEEIENLKLITPKGEKISIGDIADISIEQGFSVIRRQDKKKIVRIQSDIKVGENATVVLGRLEKRVKENLIVPNDMEIEYGGSTEDIDESFGDLFNSMIVAVILIAFILILQFQSFSQPFIILFALPLSLIGVIGGFFLIGWSISFPTFIGIVSLSGIVINDAIVLIDRIRENRKEDMPLRESIIDAALSRMKPIFLTSLTTIFGILPLALSDQTWGGLGFAIVFGLAFSTILTLIVIPNLYYTFEHRAEERRLAKIHLRQMQELNK